MSSWKPQHTEPRQWLDTKGWLFSCSAVGYQALCHSSPHIWLRDYINWRGASFSTVFWSFLASRTLRHIASCLHRLLLFGKMGEVFTLCSARGEPGTHRSQTMSHGQVCEQHKEQQQTICFELKFLFCYYASCFLLCHCFVMVVCVVGGRGQFNALYTRTRVIQQGQCSKN